MRAKGALSTTAERIRTKLSCDGSRHQKSLITSSSQEIASSAGRILALEQNEMKGRLTGSFNEKLFFKTSAKSGKNVQKVFDFILSTCLPLDVEETAERSL